MANAAREQRSTQPGRTLAGRVKDHGLLLANIGLLDVAVLVGASVYLRERGLPRIKTRRGAAL